jgi:hypothetical protein
MAKKWETFEQCHRRALDAAHADLRDRLGRPDCGRTYAGMSEDAFLNSVGVYTDTMGYKDEDDDTFGRWIDALHKAWRCEVREKGDRLVLADVLDRAIRDTTIATGERWPEEKPAAVRKLRAG